MAQETWKPVVLKTLFSKKTTWEEENIKVANAITSCNNYNKLKAELPS